MQLTISFKEDYTIVPKPRAVIYRDRNDQRKLMRLNEIHKFSDGTLTRVMEKLDHMVKDFHLFEYNKGIETRKCQRMTRGGSKTSITRSRKDYRSGGSLRSLKAFVNHLKMEMEMELPVTEMSSQSPNAKTRPTLVMKLRKITIKVSKLPQTLISLISSQVHKMAIHYKMM
ncbi:hypothetical protein Tco_0616345 [Tanacetum coccineum]